MLTDLLSFLSKLTSNNNTIASWSNLKINSQYTQLKARLNLPDSKLILLATLLQNELLTKFTDDELLTVASLNIEQLDAATAPPSHTRLLSPKAGLFDSASSRVNKYINSGEVNQLLNQLRINSFSYLDSSRIKELILFLYNQGNN